MFNFFSVPQAHAASLIDTGSVATLQTEIGNMGTDLMDTIIALLPAYFDIGIILLAVGLVWGLWRNFKIKRH
ncbi:MAG: hypothetical protein U9Q15_05550 [Patescibacteria group bacterium]|nr:hypothetical protein [Patescibacteria group bacterium]